MGNGDREVWRKPSSGVAPPPASRREGTGGRWGDSSSTRTGDVVRLRPVGGTLCPGGESRDGPGNLLTTTCEDLVEAWRPPVAAGGRSPGVQGRPGTPGAFNV